MKKSYWLIGLLFLFLVTGCGMSNTPSTKVEELLKRYNNNADVVKTELGDYLSSLDLDDDNQKDYEDIYLRQYSDMTYEIIDEKINGDNAVVTVKVKVYDYYTAEKDINDYISTHQNEFYDNNVYSAGKALKYRIGELKKVNNRTEYTMDFTLTKVNNVWTVDTLTNEQLEKIHGTYAY
ncbi:MAG: hypothetical protein GX265_03265 [Mollicutes bacterium]|nr:hypothetical protein [Mollicutes bacterium]